MQLWGSQRTSAQKRGEKVEIMGKILRSAFLEFRDGSRRDVARERKKVKALLIPAAY